MFPSIAISHSIGWLKTTCFGTVSAAFGWTAGSFVFLQTPGGDWLNGSVIAAIASAVATILILLINRHFSSKDKKEEFSRQDREKVYEEMRRLHESEKRFLHNQLQTRELSEFEARVRSHRMGNELNRTNAHIFILHGIMSKENLEIPDFKIKSYEELMFGLHDEVENFKEKLIAKMNDLSEKDDETI